MKLPRIRFGLRTFLVLVAMCGVLFGTLASMMYRGRVQRRAVEHFLRLGGQVQYDYHRTDKRTKNIDERRPRIPQFVLRLLGDDTFCRVIEVNLFCDSTTNDDLERLRDLPHLKTVYLSGGTVNGEGLKHLSGLRELEDLILGIPLVDADLRHLARLKGLKEIYLMGPSPEAFPARLLYPKEVIMDYTSYQSGLSATAVNELASHLPGVWIAY